MKGVTGRLSRQNATRNPRRTASTASALIIGVTLIGFITIFANSAQSSVTKSISGGFKGDYIVQPASQQTFAGAGPELSERMAKVPGVADVTAIAGAEALLELPDGTKSPAILAGIDPATYTKLFDAKMERGALTDLRDGQIVVDRQVAEKNKLSIGDSVKLTGRNGATLTFKVAAISDERVLLGQWSTTRADASRLTEQPTDFLVAIKAAAGTPPASLRPELKKIAKDFPTMKLQDREEFTGSIVTQISALLNVIYGLLAVSVVIALIGIANTLSLSIHERTREVGLLRATGMTRRQLRSSVRWEAVIVALMGTGIGLLLGLGLSFTLIQALKSQGFNTFAIPVGGLVTVVVFGAAVGVIASIRPASKAAKLNVLEAISSE
nr:ABC transporter permease [Candidatus Microthrix sp.]